MQSETWACFFFPFDLKASVCSMSVLPLPDMKDSKKKPIQTKMPTRSIYPHIYQENSDQ